MDDACVSGHVGDKVPDVGLVGDMRLSYAKFLHLLETKRIKRIIVYGDMHTAVVEVGCSRKRILSRG